MECAATPGCNAYHMKMTSCSIMVDVTPFVADGNRDFGGLCFIKQLYHLPSSITKPPDTAEKEALRWSDTIYAEYTGLCVTLDNDTVLLANQLVDLTPKVNALRDLTPNLEALACGTATDTAAQKAAKHAT